MKNIVLAVLASLALIVVLQNTETVETRILWMSFRMPRALLLLVAVLVGVIVGLLVGERQKRRALSEQQATREQRTP